MGTPTEHDSQATQAPHFRVEELLRPEAYPQPAERVELIETHASWLFLAGRRVYKLKKPVDLGFLDFTTLARRKHYCDEEVRLNRRLAPSVYLGTVAITRTAAGALRVNGTGEIIEWAVEMQRLPAHRILSELLERGEIDNEKLNALVDLLVCFHRAAATGPGVDEHGEPQAIRANALENFETLARFTEGEERVATPAQLAFLRARCERFHASAGEFLRTRVDERRIRDGHGDLHAGNICFTDEGVVVYDCIEFSSAFRCGDVASDLAFLSMDLDARGFPGFARYLIRRYEQLAPDPGLPLLVDSYKGYRAAVRAKVAALALSGSGRAAAERGDLRREGMRYLSLATGYELAPVVILMCGLPGCGKSWLARAIARALRASHLQSDVRRRHLPPRPETAAGAGTSGFGQGRYSTENRAATYRSLLEDVVQAQLAERSVVVDATFSSREFRRPFLDAAARMNVPILLVQVTSSEAVTLERLERRARDPSASSEADRGVYRRAREAFEPPVEVPAGQHVEVRGDGESEQAVATVLDSLVALEGA